MKISFVSSILAVLICAMFLLYSGAPANADPPGSGSNAASAHIKAAIKDLKAAKDELGGDYNCCIEPTCDFCALAGGKCPCADNVTKGKPICGNCADGWHAGKGQVKGVDVSKIQTLTPEQAKMMFDRLAKAEK